ncbi:MAG TPA: hypothetical protein VGL91_00845 [Acidobacteriota bacterium]|jgi:uncharacterized protein YggT (Ycf19 family)
MALDDDKLKIDESRKIEQHEAVKGEVRKEVHDEISRSAGQFTETDEAQAQVLAEKLKQKAKTEVVQTEAELERARGVARISQVIDYLFYLCYGFIGLDIVLDLIGANPASGFKRFVDAVVYPLLLPFRGLLPDFGHGRFRFMLSYVIGLIVYLLLHLAVNGLLRVLAFRKTSV